VIQSVILCGGNGSRLWPLSRVLYPKQYIKIFDGQSFFQRTVERLRAIDDAMSPVIVCNEEHRFFVAEQLQQLEVKGEIVLEPAGRNTAPAVAAVALIKHEDDPLLLVLPSDHFLDEAAFAEAVPKAAALAEQGYLVTFGIVPQRPETGFGYLQRGESLAEGFCVRQFKEKPDEATAEAYCRSGEYFWNSGMFLFKASIYLTELENFAPDMLVFCREAVEGRTSDLDFVRLGREAFMRCPSDSIDYAVMEKTGRCAVVPMDGAWNDLGSWSALYGVAEDKDGAGNVVRGDVIAQDTSGCYLRAGHRLLATVGIKDLVVVETADAVLVANKDRCQEVKAVFQRLRDADRSEAVHQRKVYRPWGTFETINLDERFQVKRIMVKPGHKLSLQMHYHRSEHWVVVRGTGKVINDDQELILTESQSTYIPLGKRHRLENPGKIPLEIIEIQTGTYLAEDDIVRFEDEYGR